jgi:cytochrome c556
MLKIRSELLFLGLLAFATPLCALRADSEPATDIYKLRHHEYEKLGEAFKAIRDQLNKDTPDTSALRSSAKVAKDASVNQYKWFPAGSGTEAHPKTRAKGEIWSKPAEFEAAQKSFASEAAKFETLAQGSDMTALRAQFRVLGRACKGCHDSFRIPD